MDSYTKNSYNPERLYIGINGNTGRNNEPFSCLRDLVEQNILLMAYKTPLTIEEISAGIGIPAAFVEEKVEYLIKSELMKKEGTKVFTDFVITSIKDDLKYLETSRIYAKETFDTANKIFLDMAAKCKEIEGFSSFSDEWLYMLSVLSARNSYLGIIIDAVCKKPLPFESFPDRPNGGKWIASGSQYPYNMDEKNECDEYSISGKVNVSNPNDEIERLVEWNTHIGKTHGARYKHSIGIEERVRVIDSVRTETISAFDAELLPDFEKYGFIKTDNGKKIVNVPYITSDEYKRLIEIENEAKEKYRELLFDKAVETVKKTTLNIPKNISHVPSTAYLSPLKYHSMAYIYEAIDRGVIQTEKDKNYPIMYIVKR